MKLPFSIDTIIPRILEIGMKRLPNEACGLVVPDFDKPVDDWVIELNNRSPDPLNSYVIDPEALGQITLDPEVWEDVLIWHTHPSGHIGPSKRDVETMIPQLKRRYLVVALPGGEAVLF